MRIITRTNGQPYATEASARQQLTAKGLQDTHEVVSHEGGYALVPKSAKALKVGDMVRVNGHRARGDVHQFGTTETIRNWHKERTLLEVKRLPTSTKVYAGKPGFSGCDLAFHVSELDLVEKDDPITLQPGDYVSTKGMTEEQYHAVARAFMGAGFKWYGADNKHRIWEVIVIDGAGDIIGANYQDEELSRHLTIDQVLGAANAGTTTPQPEETTMTADPITTLKQARAARDEADQAYHQALAAARECLGEGFALTEVGADSPLVDGEDMTDPANWREGDVVECVRPDQWESLTRQGNKVLFEIQSMRDGKVPVLDGTPIHILKSFRFHHRPN